MIFVTEVIFFYLYTMRVLLINEIYGYGDYKFFKIKGC